MDYKTIMSLTFAYILYILQGVNYSQLAPFYPNIAKDDKGVSTTVIGLITGAFDISGNFSTPSKV